MVETRSSISAAASRPADRRGGYRHKKAIKRATTLWTVEADQSPATQAVNTVGNDACHFPLGVGWRDFVYCGQSATRMSGGRLMYCDQCHLRMRIAGSRQFRLVRA